MEVKEKNKKLLIVVGVLLLFGGISLAYFVSKAILGGNGGSTSVTTAVINGATLNVEGVLSFEDLDILPGHKTVSSVKVTATGNNELIPYNLIWQGTNTLTTPLNFTIYKTSEEINATSTCNKKTKQMGASKALLEECTISNLDKLGSEIATGTINKNETKVNLVKDEFITATSTGDIKYYYVILEYPNLDEPQNYDLEGTIEGEVTVEESNIKPDINILAAYVVQDDGTYKQVEDIPQEGYTINSEKSTCSNGATPTGNTPNITINNLNKSGTSCYLYFDLYSSIDTLLSSQELESEAGYRYQGANPNNYLKFNNEVWRIIGIFDTIKSNGENENLIKIIREDSIGNLAWDTNNKNNWESSSLKKLLNEGDYYNRTGEYSYSGLTTETKQMIETVIWNLGGTSGYETVEGMYTAERSTQVYGSNPIKWAGKIAIMYPSDYGYASPYNTCNRNTKMCPDYNTSGCYDNNWLYKSAYNQNVLTINTAYNDRLFSITSSGSLGYNDGVFVQKAVRPTVYLKSSVKIIAGKGTQSNPYIVAD